MGWANSKHSKPWHEAVCAQASLDSCFVTRHADVVEVGVKPFQPYSLRHSALTRRAEAGCDAFTLARIAEHSSITITQRYCHPQADAIERAFSQMANRPKLVRDGSQEENPLPVGRDGLPVSMAESRCLVSREGIEPPTY